MVWAEAVLALYCLVGLGIAVYFGEWAAVPFQAFFVIGFGLISGFNLKQIWTVRRAEAVES